MLFVCKGNICRSPFAEKMAFQISDRIFKEELKFFSAGLYVNEPVESPIEVHTNAKIFGVSLDGHKSRRITRKMAESFDMIIAMESWHVQFLRDMFPDLESKFFLLALFEKGSKGWFSYQKSNVADPYGKSGEHFLDCFARIERCLDLLITHIANSNSIVRKHNAFPAGPSF